MSWCESIITCLNMSGVAHAIISQFLKVLCSVAHLLHCHSPSAIWFQSCDHHDMHQFSPGAPLPRALWMSHICVFSAENAWWAPCLHSPHRTSQMQNESKNKDHHWSTLTNKETKNCEPSPHLLLLWRKINSFFIFQMKFFDRCLQFCFGLHFCVCIALMRRCVTSTDFPFHLEICEESNKIKSHSRRNVDPVMSKVTSSPKPPILFS